MQISFRKQLWDRTGFCASLFLFLYLFGSMLLPLYSGIDNYLISLVTNGVYSNKDNYVIFLHPFLCGSIKWLHNLLPFADVYLLLTEILTAIGVWIFSYCTLELSSTYYQKFYSQVILYALVMYKTSRCFDNFTITAVFFFCVGIILIGYALLRYNGVHRIRIIVCSILYIAFGYMWRSDAAIMGVPYLGVVLFTCYVILWQRNSTYKRPENYTSFIRKDIILHCSCIFIVVMLVFGGLMIINTIVHTSSYYCNAVAYNNTRSYLTDYSQTWAEIADAPNDSNVTENDTKVAATMFLADTENLTLERLQKIAEHASKDIIPIPSIEYVYVMLMSMTIFCPTFAILELVSLLTILFSKYNRYQKISIILIFLSYCCYSTYFIHIGRVLPRVYSGLYYYIFVAVMIILSERSPLQCINESKTLLQNKCRVVINSFSLIIIIFVSIVQLALVMKHCKPMQLALTANYNNDNVVDQNWQEDDNLYVWEVYSLDETLMKDYMNTGKLYSCNFIKHNIPSGEWIYGQRYFEDYLTWSKIGNPLKALLTRKNTYYVGTDKSIKIVQTYIREHCSDKYNAVRVRDYQGLDKKIYSVWKFTRE